MSHGRPSASAHVGDLGNISADSQGTAKVDVWASNASLGSGEINDVAGKSVIIHEKEDNPKVSKSFDLQFGYLELVSGGRRLHDPQKLRARLVQQGLNPASFEDHLRAFEWGMPPHSGWGLGYDRLMMVLTGQQNVRDVVLYPRDTERISP